MSPSAPTPTTEVDGDGVSYVVRRYCDLVTGHGQLTTFVAVAEGVKPVMDDWVAGPALSEYTEFVTGLGLSIEVGPVFETLAESELAEITGGASLNTTRARAGVASDSAAGRTQVFVGHDAQRVSEAARAGWYNLVAEDRVVLKPWIDHYWFGRALGYPDCCLDAFARDGAWNLTNPYAAAAARTGNTALALCNPVMRHSGFSYLNHYPCRFDCPASARYSASVRRALLGHGTGLVERADRYARAPYLLLSGWAGFGFDGVVERTSARYSAYWQVPTNKPNNAVAELLSAGNRVELVGNVLTVWRSDAFVGSYEIRADHYAPEHPTFVAFRGPFDSAEPT